VTDLVPPTGGEGGNSALRDAGLLLEHIVKISSSDDRMMAMKTEIPKYEKSMVELSRVSVKTSYRNAKMASMEGHVVPYRLRFVMRVVNFFFGYRE
jgi:2-polyprenyl-6-methoxyphenol hydroxylase-like FAD-dependent oxidoreductase